jgi:hypothetical protein
MEYFCHVIQCMCIVQSLMLFLMFSTEYLRSNFNPSPTDVSPNKKAQMFRPLDNVSLGRSVPWTMCSLDDTSLTDVSRLFWTDGPYAGMG